MATTPAPNDVLRRMFDDSMTMLDPWLSAWSNAATLATTPTAAPAKKPSRHHDHDHDHDHHHDHDHGDCHCGCGCGSKCSCSAIDADLVLTARVGERRIVPLVIHNEWRRERPITISVSAFRPCDPCAEDVEIAVTAQPHGEVVLPPCSRTVVEVIVALPDKNRRNEENGTVAPLTRCTTVYGDISTDGCARPVRLAVVVLPADCDAHEIDCCGCCGC